MTNTIRSLSLSLLLAASAFAAPAYAQFNVSINIAPPAPQYEIVPAISPGYVWAPGYWGWNNDRYIWVRGRPIAQRVGFRWEPDRWDERNRNFVRTAGHWKHDNDFKPAKMKKEKKHKDHDDNDEGRHDNGKHKGNKHRD